MACAPAARRSTFADARSGRRSEWASWRRSTTQKVIDRRADAGPRRHGNAGRDPRSALVRQRDRRRHRDHARPAQPDPAERRFPAMSSSASRLRSRRSPTARAAWTSLSRTACRATTTSWSAPTACTPTCAGSPSDRRRTTSATSATTSRSSTSRTTGTWQRAMLSVPGLSIAVRDAGDGPQGMMLAASPELEYDYRDLDAQRKMIDDFLPASMPGRCPRCARRSPTPPPRASTSTR